MSRWWRAYDEAVNDPKLQLLSDAMFRAWFNVMCIASKHDGRLPPNDALAFMLRVKPEKAAELVTKLHKAGLLDRDEAGFAPHNWEGRQFKSDRDETTASRSKRYRDGKRDASRENGTVTRDATRDDTPTSRPPETEAETEQKDSDADASGAHAPIDHRKRLFDEGLKKLARITGKGPDSCRSFVGKCLAAAGDDAVTVLGLIEDAERNQTVDPSAWIAARLKPQGNPSNAAHGKTGILHAIDLALERSQQEDAHFAMSANSVLGLPQRSIR